MFDLANCCKRLMSKFPFYRQPESMDCGAACFRMVAKYYGKNYSLADLRQITHTNREGASLLGLSDAAEKLGFRTHFGIQTNCDNLIVSSCSLKFSPAD